MPEPVLTLAMVETLITIRNARKGDAAEIAEVHDAAWRWTRLPGRDSPAANWSA